MEVCIPVVSSFSRVRHDRFSIQFNSNMKRKTTTIQQLSCHSEMDMFEDDDRQTSSRYKERRKERERGTRLFVLSSID